MTPQVLATAKVYWLAPEQGGRMVPPSGSVYAATAQFDEQEGEFFSIVLRFPTPKEQIENGATSVVDEVEVGFLSPELVKSKLAPGKEFSITEGNRIVAQCQIQSVSSLARSDCP
jgi:translation elongation factor EF-Tu-like GTPase